MKLFYGTIGLIAIAALLGREYLPEADIITREPARVAETNRTEMDRTPRSKEVVLTLADTVITVKAHRQAPKNIELDNDDEAASVWWCSPWMESQVGGAYRKCEWQ